MLQINSGKLFTNGVGHTNLLRGVLYTNLKLPWRHDLVTCVGTLRETDGPRGNLAIIYELEEKIEKSSDGPGVLLSHTISPFLQDFSAIASFGMNVVMSPDAGLVERLTSGRPGLSSYDSPRKFVRQYFDEQVYLKDDVAEDFVKFTNQLIGLERIKFLSAMRAIRTFVAGMHRIADDLGLAYTLMVSAIESLAQDVDKYDSSWQDVDERKRIPIDKILRDVPSEISSEVKKVILSVEHVSLGRRYREFVLSHIDETYFRSADTLLGRPLARYELVEALKQAYAYRSKYIHNLRKLPDEISHPFGEWESIDVDRQPALTFQGISRLTRHVIKSFVMKSSVVSHEAYNYSREEAGVITMRMAPEYWIGHALKDANQIRQRIEGFLQQLIPILSGAPDSKLTDLRPVLADIERLLPKARKTNRPGMVVLHALFNFSVSEAQRTEGYRELLDKYKDETLLLIPEMLIARTYFKTTHDWTLQQHQEVHDKYFKQRTKPNGLHAPRQIDIAITLELAERYRAAGQLDLAKSLLAMAVDNHPGYMRLLDFETNFSLNTLIDWELLLFPKPENTA